MLMHTTRLARKTLYLSPGLFSDHLGGQGRILHIFVFHSMPEKQVTVNLTGVECLDSNYYQVTLILDLFPRYFLNEQRTRGIWFSVNKARVCGI